MKEKLIYFLLITVSVLMSSCREENLDLEGKSLFTNDWEFQYEGEWYPAFVPGYIHTDLQLNKLIDDPFYGTNEQKLQWISDSTWVYRLIFDGKNIKDNLHPEFVFEGVTGYAEFYLNGVPLLNQEGNNFTDNSFRIWRFDLTKNLKLTDNELIVKFIPSKQIVEERKRALPYALPDDRVFLRNPPYQGGWDWGPKLVTCGFSKPVYLSQWKDLRLDNLDVRTKLIAEDEASIFVAFSIESERKESVTIKYLVDDKVVKTIRGVKLQESDNDFATEIRIKNPQLWYPNGMGEQHLYNVSVQVDNGGKKKHLDTRVGLRKIELNTAKDSIGSAFEFLVNGQPVFMKGVNWIPADFFPTRIKDDKYRYLLESCKNANMNMIRVWGGGIYEPDVFYDICDELGILVWQDFMYACALYPGDSLFMRNAEIEAKEQVKRLRNHPSLALWCGNNEVKNGWDDWGWKEQYKPNQLAEIEGNMHKLFDDLLPNVVREWSSETPYISTSPLWGWGHDESCTEGDAHYWGVWWGELPFEMWEEKTGRFMAEYGFQSYPEWNTITSYAPENELIVNSASLKNHQKHSRGVQIINKAMLQYFSEPKDLKEYAYYSQLVQAYGVGWAIETHRRQLPHCMGTLFWQLNDCWPVASWSSIDYYGRWKALQYEAKRKYEPVIITTKPLQKEGLPICIVSDLLSNVYTSVELKLCNLYGEIKDSVHLDSVLLEAQSSKEITLYRLPKRIRPRDLSSHYLLINLYNADNELIANKIYFYNYPGKMNFSANAADVNVKRLDAGTKNERYVFTLKSDQIQYGVQISSNLDGNYSDNYFILLPGEEKKVIFKPKSPSHEQLKAKIKSYGK